MRQMNFIMSPYFIQDLNINFCASLHLIVCKCILRFRHSGWLYLARYANRSNIRCHNLFIACGVLFTCVLVPSNVLVSQTPGALCESELSALQFSLLFSVSCCSEIVSLVLCNNFFSQKNCELRFEFLFIVSFIFAVVGAVMQYHFFVPRLVHFRWNKLLETGYMLIQVWNPSPFRMLS